MFHTILKFSRCSFLLYNWLGLMEWFQSSVQLSLNFYSFSISKSRLLLTASSGTLSYYLIETEVVIVVRQNQYSLWWHVVWYTATLTNHNNSWILLSFICWYEKTTITRTVFTLHSSQADRNLLTSRWIFIINKKWVHRIGIYI